jgi:hypothetical protein
VTVWRAAKHARSGHRGRCRTVRSDGRALGVWTRSRRRVGQVVRSKTDLALIPEVLPVALMVWVPARPVVDGTAAPAGERAISGGRGWAQQDCRRRDQAGLVLHLDHLAVGEPRPGDGQGRSPLDPASVWWSPSTGAAVGGDGCRAMAGAARWHGCPSDRTGERSAARLGHAHRVRLHAEVP